MSKDSLMSVGRSMLYKNVNSQIPQTVGAPFFAALDDDEEALAASLRHPIHLMGPLNFDIGRCNGYMMDNVNIRIRLELAPPNILIMTSDADLYRYRIDMCKLWCKKVLPVPAALLALKKSMAGGAKNVEYMFERPIIKSIIFPARNTSLSIDDPFHGIIPHKIIAFMLNQTAFDGAYDTNPNYFTHNNITDFSLDINGNTLSRIKCEFPRYATQAFYQTLESLGLENNSHLLTKENFCAGRSIFVFDTSPTNTPDVLHLERRANLRVCMTTSAPPAANRILFLIGLTTGMLQVNSAGGIFLDYLQ
jgi:hypothetical protein